MKNILKITFLILLLAAPNFAQTTNKVETEYDRFKDLTTISVRLSLLGSLSLDFDKTFEGKKLTSTPKNVSLFFMSSNMERNYFGIPSCIFLVDDQRIDLGNGKYRAGTTVELLRFSISTEDLKKIIDAKKVEMQLGKNEFTLTEPQLEAVKEFYKQIVP